MLEGEAGWWRRIWRAVRQAYAGLRLGLGVRAEEADDLIAAFRHVRIAARAGAAEAQFRLGGYYERGRGIIRSPGDAAEWYRRAAVQGHTEAQLSLSLMYLHGQGVRRTSAWYDTAKRLDEAAAARNREALFPHGFEIARNYQEALRWSLAAAHSGRIEAQANAGLLLLQGLGCEADHAEALRWLSTAAERGNAEAQYGMGMLLDRGLGVEADLAAACRWYEAAADQGHHAAQATLGYLYGFGDPACRDRERAKQLLGRASDHGNAAAPYYLGVLYREERSGADPLDIEGCFLRSAQRGHVPAMVALANFYMHPEAGQKAADRAEIWYRAAAEAGDAEAQFQLGALCATAGAESSNSAAALRYYRQAADQGHALAQHNCAELLLQSNDSRAAAPLFAAAAAQGVADSQLRLGDLHASGRGVPRSLKIARDWYEQAAGQGLRLAALKLQRVNRVLDAPRSPASVDAVQIVVWSLDDASWSAAFGGVERYVDTLEELASRGIVSLLAAGASTTRARELLERDDIWLRSVFPMPGPEAASSEIVRILDGAIVARWSVMLIDEDPDVRLRATMWGLQVAGASIVPQLRDDSRFAGGDDPTLKNALRSVLLEEISMTEDEEDPRWYHAAAEAGDAEAQAILAWALLTGDGCEADAVASLSWFKRSADAGFAPAQLQLGIMYRDGVGASADQDLAVHWIQKAAEAGNDEARALLEPAGSAGADGASPAAELPWYRVCAEEGDPEAQSILAWACLTGDHCEQDEVVASFWFEKSARAGFVPSQLQLGTMYYEGIGVPQRHDEAAAWFQRAARAGDPEAQFRLAAMLWQGEGLAGDRAAALEWYRKAAQAGNADAAAFIESQEQGSAAEEGAPRPMAAADADSPARAEAVRLVIWDLDDTFWRGTLAEGGIEAYIQSNHDLVETLAGRGIMSSICSRNYYAAARGVLEEHGLWEYFIFPSINWAPKGERVAAIVECAQLRAATVLFVDDNPQNRAAVAAAVPGIQVATPQVLTSVAEDPRFQGKDDHGLTRLAQYKLLERRHVDRQSAPGGDEEFLRSADIRVMIDTDIVANLDRAIELVNRTNQLNFTKRRLPDSATQARAQLQQELSPFYSHAGLVRVIDKYGDYGYCGYYRLEGDTLVDYCFSCRILGMGVESWLYERLGRPKVTIAEQVLVDLHQPCRVDWVRLVGNDGAAVAVANRVIPEVRLRGGCELDALAHYFRLVSEAVRCETNFSRTPLFVRMDTTAQLAPALGQVPPSFREAATRLGFAASDFDSEFLSPAAADTILLYSPWADIYQEVYRHKSGGFRIPVNVHIHHDLTQISDADLAAALTDLKLNKAHRAKIISIVETLRAQYDYELPTPLPFAIDIIRALFERIPKGARLFFILPYEWYKDGETLVPRAAEYNHAVRELAGDYSAVTLVPMNDLVQGAAELQDSFDHFDRVVYFRLYQRIMQLIGARQSAAEAAVEL